MQSNPKTFLSTLFVSAMAAWISPASAQDNSNPIRFEDAADKLGLTSILKDWELGHGAGWGDVDGDGRPDLYFGAFADRPKWDKSNPNAPIPNLLLLNKSSGFVLSDEKDIRLVGRRDRASGILFVDLNNTGRLDLLVAHHTHVEGDDGTLLFENLGGGKFRNVTPKDPNWEPAVAYNQARHNWENNRDKDKGPAPAGPKPVPMVWPSVIPVRNVTAVDLNNDGLLDLVFCDGGYGPNGYNPRWRLIVMENKGSYKFEDASAKYGFTAVPEGIQGNEQGLAIGDVNGDGIPDFFICGSNRLFVSSGTAPLTYHEVQNGYFTRAGKGLEAMPCGAAFGDLNGDGLLDLVTTVHGVPSRIHLYLNRGVQNGEVRFEQVTQDAGVAAEFPRKGMGGLPVKNAHVALRDVDNDGKVDIMLAMVYKDSRDQVQPMVLRNEGNNAKGVPTFTRPPNDRIIGYYAAAPVADYDGDGRIDIFMCTWGEFLKTAKADHQPEIPSYLFRNVTEGGHWLEVKVVGKGPGLNRMGIGSIVRLYEAGHAGDAKYLLGRQDIAIGTGYASGDEALAYLGLGKHQACDVEVSWGKRKVVQANVKVDQLLSITVDASQQAEAGK